MSRFDEGARHDQGGCRALSNHDRDRGCIVYFANGHGLVVLAPDDVHDDLGGLLRQLR